MTDKPQKSKVTMTFGDDVVEIEMTEQQAAHYLAGGMVTFSAESGEPIITEDGKLGLRHRTDAARQADADS